MPLRNLLLILLASVGTLLCQSKLEENRYARKVGTAIRIVEQNYVRPVEGRELYESAMKAMFNSLDDYSQYIPPAEFERLEEELNQKFGGIGIMVERHPDDKGILVVSPLAGTPAYRAGVQAGDVITKIDDESVERENIVGQKFSQVVEKMRGDPGTSVKLTLLHRGEKEPVEVEVKREVIRTESVMGDTHRPDGTWNFVLEQRPNIGYLRIVQFGEDTGREVKEALATISHCDGLVIDLRNDPGGYLKSACDVCEQFLDEGSTIVSVRGRNGELHETPHLAGRGPKFPATTPVVVLVNKYSASASEIMAACLQDHGRAAIVGTRSWGKGSVQNLIPFDDDQSAIKLTTATYWRPSGRNIHRLRNDTDDKEWGVKPDPGLEVKLTEDEEDKLFTRRRERDVIDDHPQRKPDAPANANEIADPQLEKAVQYVLRTTSGRS